MTDRKLLMSWDAWLFLALSVLYIKLYEDPKGVLLVFALALYVAIDLFWPWQHLPAYGAVLRRVYTIKLGLVLLAVVLMALMPAALWIVKRRASAPHLYAHDGLLQTEAAMDFMRQGLNPYAQDYSDTPLGQREFEEEGLTINPALDYVAYMPFLFEFSYPFYRMGLALWGWWDQRMLYIPILVVLLGLLPLLTRRPWARLCLVLLVGLNPLLMLGFIEGRNDVFELLLLLVAALALQRGRPALGFASLMLAAATKQTAWFVTPFYALYVAGRDFWRRSAWGCWVRKLSPGLLVFGLAVLPFLIWDPAALLSDTLGIITSSSAAPTIAKGYGLGELLLDIGVLPHVTAPFPFGVFQLAVGIPALAGLAFWLYRRADVRLIWACGALLMLITGLAGRFFMDNHVGLVFVLLALAAFSGPGCRQEVCGVETA
jgi:hypothetical protein